MKKILLVLLFASFNLSAQVPSPKSHFGFNIGDNYHLATFTQTEAYLKKVAASSNRVKLQSIGLTEEGRNQYMVIVSDPANIKNLAKYKAISQRLARAEGLSELEAKTLAKEGKAIVWIDGGLHATETVNSPMDRICLPIHNEKRRRNKTYTPKHHHLVRARESGWTRTRF